VALLRGQGVGHKRSSPPSPSFFPEEDPVMRKRFLFSRFFGRKLLWRSPFFFFFSSKKDYGRLPLLFPLIVTPFWWCRENLKAILPSFSLFPFSGDPTVFPDQIEEGDATFLPLSFLSLFIFVAKTERRALFSFSPDPFQA